MSRDLDSLLDTDRRAACQRHDTELSQWQREWADKMAKAHPLKSVSVNRAEATLESGDSFDLALDAMPEFGRVEVRPFFQVSDATPADCLSPAECIATAAEAR